MKVSKAAYSLGYAAENLTALLQYRRLSLKIFQNMKEVERLKLERYFNARGYSLDGLIYEAKGIYRTAYQYFRRAVRINNRDDIAKLALRKYRQAMN